jgi:hypothetical protein
MKLASGVNASMKAKNKSRVQAFPKADCAHRR